MKKRAAAIRARASNPNIGNDRVGTTAVIAGVAVGVLVGVLVGVFVGVLGGVLVGVGVQARTVVKPPVLALTVVPVSVPEAEIRSVKAQSAEPQGGAVSFMVAKQVSPPIAVLLGVVCGPRVVTGVPGGVPWLQGMLVFEGTVLGQDALSGSGIAFETVRPVTEFAVSRFTTVIEHWIEAPPPTEGGRQFLVEPRPFWA